MAETSQKKNDQTSDQVQARRKRDRSASEERLMKAAEEIFSKHGFKGATTRMIAKKADVNESLIGRYFSGKLGLLMALIEKHVEEMTDKPLPYPPQECLADELCQFINSKFKTHCQKNQDFFKIVLSQALVDIKFLKKIREIVPMFQENALMERLKLLVENGRMKKATDLDMIIRDIDVFFHGSMLFELIISGRDKNEVLGELEQFVSNYAKAFET